MENDELANALKHKREILFSKNGDLLRDLDWKLTECDRRIAIRWALDGAKECEKRLFEKYPFDDTAAQAIKEAEKWARGKIKCRRQNRRYLNATHGQKSRGQIARGARCSTLSVRPAQQSIHSAMQSDLRYTN